MKRLLAAFFILSFVLSLCACAKTSIEKDVNVTLSFIYEDKSITVALEKDEAAKVINILDGNAYDPAIAGTPSCGFNENISLTVGDQTFAIACDTCSYIQDLSNQKYFNVAEEEMEYIHSLFEKHGGYFPCL